MRSGYQDKPDGMRMRADKAEHDLFGMKCGGKVKAAKVKKYAVGGVAKIRLGQSTASGKPKK